MKERILILLMTIVIVFTIITPGLVPGAEAAGGTVTKSYTATMDTMELNGHIQYDGIHDNDGDGYLSIGRSNDEYGNVRQRAGITFDLGVPEGSIISAELVLTVAAVIRNSNHTLYMEARGSAANNLNYAAFPSLDTNSPYADKFTAKSIAEVPIGTYLQNQSITFNVKSAVDAFTDISDRKITFMLNGNETDADSGWFSIHSLETYGNAAYRPKLVITYETGPVNTPPSVFFTIMEGVMTSTSTVNLSIAGSDPDAGDSVTHMRFANSTANLSAASWLPFSNTATFSLTGGDGVKTIYMQLRDSNNGISANSFQSILLDQTAPTGTLIINEGATWTKSNTVTLKGTYTDGSGLGVEQARLSNINGSWQTSWFNIADLSGRSWVLSAGEGDKTVYVQYRDKVGNSNSSVISSTITVDTIAPVITNVENGKVYNSTVTPLFNEGSGLLNGNPYSSGTTITQDGAYTLSVTDPAGNVTTVSFTIDRVAPIVAGVASGGIYNTNKTITFNEGTATLNGAAFVSGLQITLDGAYTLVVTDAAGNVTAVSFTIDKTAPTVTGVNAGGTYKEPVTATFNEGTATLNGAAFVSGTEIELDGAYTLIVMDAAGNVTTVSFTIDRVTPIVAGVASGGIYNTNKTITFNEGTATLNGAAFVSGLQVTLDGAYTLVVTDAAGNVTTVSFTIDRVAPIVAGVASGGIYNTNKTITFNEGTATLNGAAFVSGLQVTLDGAYTLIVTDAAGNVTTVSFTIDKTAPTVTGVTAGGTYKKAVTVTFNEGTATLNGVAFTGGTEIELDGAYTLVVTDAAGNVTTVSFTIDKTAPTVTGVNTGRMYKEAVTATFNEGTAKLNGAAFVSGTEIELDGNYTLIVTDAAGNVTTVSFTIDKTAPTVTGVDAGGTYKEPVTATFNEGTAKLNGAAFVSGTKIELDGNYTLIVTDAAGNVTTVSFTIDKTAPIVTGVVNTGEYTNKVTVSFNEGTATLNGAAFVSDTEIDRVGAYTLVVTDAAGNVTTVQFRVIEYSGSTGNTETPSQSEVLISLGGKSVKAPNLDVHFDTDGKKVTTVSLDEKQLLEMLKGASDNSVITVTIRNQSDIVIWEMNAALLDILGKSNVIIQMLTENAAYNFPLDQVHVDEWRNQLGDNIPLEDIKIKAEMSKLPNSAFVFNNSGDGQVSLVVPPVSFSIKGSHGNKEIELNQFDTFVERRIAIPVGIDPKRITTGVKLMSDGTIIHIPTKVVREEGHDYAILNSMTNSIYGLIYHNKTFNDVSTHWAQESINSLASRLIIKGADEQRFLPDSEITRAEFMAIITRALGLSSANKTFQFKDIAEKAWYYQAVQIGYSYGLVDGYSDGFFKPNEKITRQEAMVILSRAMMLVELNMEIDNTKQQGIVNNFADSEQLASWARQAAALTIEIGVIGGYNSELRPLQNITRAETAAIIQRFLQKAEFIS